MLIDLYQGKHGTYNVFQILKLFGSLRKLSPILKD